MPSRFPELDPVVMTSDLVAIESVNPALVPGAAGEALIADYCEHWLGDHGLEVHRLESHRGRPSIVGIARGSGGGRSIMLNGHYDTVSTHGYDGDPLSGEVRDGRLYGRGSYDMKSGLAVAMATAAMAKLIPMRGDVIVACVADEEHASIGTEEVLRHFTADAGIVTEPNGMGITVAHKGFCWFDIVFEGRAAHGSLPDAGIDAITRAGHFLAAMGDWNARLQEGLPHPLLGYGSVHASTISGGSERSSYPAECRVAIERRTIPGETADTVAAEMDGILLSLSGSVADLAWRIEPVLERRPFETGQDEHIVTVVRRCAETVLGREPVIRGEAYWTDCALMQNAGIPTLLIGVEGEGAHAATEWADVTSIRTLNAILLAAVTEYCS
jgi:acetylornithine deacetylase